MIALRSFLFVATVLIGSPYASAATSASAPHFTAELVAESRAPAPGKDLAVALVIQPEKGWHIYWKNPGEAGLPPQPEWTLPTGFSTGELQHPVPSELIVDGLTCNIHEGGVTLLTDVSVPDGLPPGSPIPVKLNIKLAICSKGRCIPEKVTLDLPLTVGNGAPDTRQTGLFLLARSRLPEFLDGTAQYEVNDSSLKIFLPLPASGNINSVHIFFDADGVVSHGKLQFTHKNGGLSITIPRSGIPTHTPLDGVARVVYSGPAAAPGMVKGYRFSARPAAGSQFN